MKTMKKVLAVVLAMAMILAVSAVALAASETATLTVSGLADEGTNTVTYVKVIEPDATAKCGYKIASGVTLELDGNTLTAAEYLALDATKLAKVVVTGGTTESMTVSGTTATATVPAGVYAVTATNDNSGKVAISYNPMVLNVAYNKADKTNSGYTYWVDDANSKNSVVAKYSTIKTEKDNDSEYTEIGKNVEYTITTLVPSHVDTFTLTDTITGAVYDTTVAVSVKVGGAECGTDKGVVSISGNQMVIDLTSKLAGNAGKTVVVTYEATVKEIKVNNIVITEDGDHKWEPATSESYTGAAKLTKYGEDDNTKLAGAKFNVYKDTDKTAMLKFTKTAVEGVYVYDPVNGSADIVTAADGTVTVEGLDLGTYWFKEVEPPKDYSINTTDVSATITEKNTTKEETLTPATTSMTDTKLSALPSTGGIGTTIFTVVGVLIMIAAAAMFFVSRRKRA